MVFHPESNQDFIDAMARAGAHHAYKNNLPLPAMLGDVMLKVQLAHDDHAPPRS